MKVGTCLAILRNIRGWNQEELSRRAGIRAGTLSDYERGKMVPGLNTLHRLLEALGYKLSDLETVEDCLGRLERSPQLGRVEDIGEQIQEATRGLGEYVARVVGLALALLRRRDAKE